MDIKSYIDVYVSASILMPGNKSPLKKDEIFWNPQWNVDTIESETKPATLLLLSTHLVLLEIYVTSQVHSYVFYNLVNVCVRT